MKPEELVNLIRASGASLVLLPNGRLKVTGADVERWEPVLDQYREELRAALQAPAADTAAGG